MNDETKVGTQAMKFVKGWGVSTLRTHVKAGHRKLHGHNLVIIVAWNLLFICSYGIYTDVIHLLILFEHQCCVYCLNMNITCLFILFKHKYCMSIHVVYTRKLCTRFSCLNNAWHSCLNNTNPWNNWFCMGLEQTHETYKFVMDNLNHTSHFTSYHSKFVIKNNSTLVYLMENLNLKDELLKYYFC
jgi:hypothetical protein